MIGDILGRSETLRGALDYDAHARHTRTLLGRLARRRRLAMS